MKGRRCEVLTGHRGEVLVVVVGLLGILRVEEGVLGRVSVVVRGRLGALLDVGTLGRDLLGLSLVLDLVGVLADLLLRDDTGVRGGLGLRNGAVLGGGLGLARGGAVTGVRARRRGTLVLLLVVRENLLDLQCGDKERRKRSKATSARARSETPRESGVGARGLACRQLGGRLTLFMMDGVVVLREEYCEGREAGKEAGRPWLHLSFRARWRRRRTSLPPSPKGFASTRQAEPVWPGASSPGEPEDNMEAYMPVTAMRAAPLVQTTSAGEEKLLFPSASPAGRPLTGPP